MRTCLILLTSILASTALASTAFADDTIDADLQHSIEQLRQSIGRWEVVTEFLGPDGEVVRSLEGTYEFEWVVPDRVVRGVSRIPALDRASGILFYVNEASRTIEMVSVGADGRLWVMTGPLGGETRTTEPFATADGGTGRLRFTRHDVEEDSFRSRMEHTDDDGKTWKPGNRQVFRRAE